MRPRLPIKLHLHVAARLHAFVHGLFRSSDAVETRALYAKVVGRFQHRGLDQPQGRQLLANDLATDVLQAFALDTNHPQSAVVTHLIERLLDYEGLFILQEIDWSEKHSVTEYWTIRDQLNVQQALLLDFPNTCQLFKLAVIDFLKPIFQASPALLTVDSQDEDITVPTQLIHTLGAIGSITERALNTFASDDLKRAGLFVRLIERLEYNLIAASGGNPTDPGGFNRAPKLPSKSDINDPAELVSTYLSHTPLLPVFDQQLDFAIPTMARFEHHHIVAGSGHGKSQTLQYLIGSELGAVARGERTVIVLDSQGDLIRTVSNLAEFAPGGALHERIVIIDPTDVEWPVSLNLFDVGIERLADYDPLERERLTNSILELYDFVLGSLLAAEMTQKQSVIFRYVTRLMLVIPDATIHTLRELMEPGGDIKFAEHIAKLSGTAKHFFETEFSSKEFEQTKKQVLRRLWGILENQTFERMFSHPESKLDLFSEMNAGKVILINTAKDLLKEQGTEIFGRFFIAMIAQSAQERATLPAQERMPTFVYVDEAADYFDRNIAIILATARKYHVGMVLAHQYLGQLEPKLQEAFAANTSIKFAGGVSAKDARTLAPMLYCSPELIEGQPKGSFASFIRGVTPSALPLSFPFGFLEAKPTMTAQQREGLQEIMREKYAVHYTALHQTDDEPEDAADPPSGGEREQATNDALKKPPQSGPDDINTDPSDQW